MSQRRKRERAARQRVARRDVCPRCGSVYGRLRMTRAQRRARSRSLPTWDQHRGSRWMRCDHAWHTSHRVGAGRYDRRLVLGLDPYTRSVRGARR